MAVVVESHTGAIFEADTDQTFTLAAPAGIASGDLLITILAKDTGDAGNRKWTTVPAGWSGAITAFDNSTVQLDIYWKEAGGSEPENYEWGFSNTAGTVFGGAVLRISGADTTAPININGTGTGSSQSADCPSVETTSGNCLLLRIFSADDDDYTDNSTPAGLTVLFAESTTDGNDMAIGCAYETQEGAGVSGVESFTGFGDTEEWCAATLAIEPSAAGGISIPVVMANERRRRQ